MTEVDGAAVFYSALPERRINPFRPELRDGGDGKPGRIVGYASVFNKLSRKLGGFVEQVNDRAFSGSKAEGWPDVVCRFNHNDDFLLGTIRGSTLGLDVDGTGLIYDVIPPSFRSDILELCRRGDVSSSSFAFRVPDGGDDWKMSDWNLPLRTLLSVELVDVAPVTTPAYPDATAAARSVDGAVMSLASRFQADPAEIRSLLDNNQGVKLFKRSDRPSAPAQPEVSTEKEEGSEMREVREKISTASKNDLPDSAFAYIESGGTKDESGKTTPRSKRHFPIHDAAHVRNALSRIGAGAQFGQQALPKVKAAAKKFGIGSDEQNNLFDVLEELRGELPVWLRDASEEVDALLEALASEERDSAPAKSKKAPAKGSKAASSDSSDAATDTDDTDDSDEDDEDEAGKGVEDEERDSAPAKSKKAPAKGSKAAADDADAKEDAQDDGDDEDDEDDDSPADSKASAKGKSGSKQPAGTSDNGKKAGKGLPPWLQNKRRMMELMEKRHDPYLLSDDED